MKKNRSIYCFLVSFFLLALMLQSCVWESNRGVQCHDQTPVTITVNVMDSDATPKHPKVRALWEDDVNPSWEEQKIEAEEVERTIHHVFLYVYKGSSLEKVYLYNGLGSGKLLDNPINGLEERAITSATLNTNDFMMELELLPDTYHFVIIANSHQALSTAQSGTIPNPSDLVEESQVFTSDDLLGENRKYLPMVGQGQIVVPQVAANAAGGSATNRIDLQPSIPLERVHARVEFYLTTAKDGATAGTLEYLSESLNGAKVTGLTLLNEYNGYSLLPQNGEYTATGAGLSTPLYGKDYTNIAASPIRKIARDSFHTGANKVDGTIEMLKNRLLPFDAGAGVKYIYVPSATYKNDKTNALTIKFNVEFGNDKREYLIPLYTPNEAPTHNNYYHICRNTIYQIHATLNGPNLDVIDYIVDPWVDQGVDIPW